MIENSLNSLNDYYRSKWDIVIVQCTCMNRENGVSSWMCVQVLYTVGRCDIQSYFGERCKRGIYCLNHEISDRHKRPIKGMFTETHEKSEHIYTHTYAKDYNR